jgi:hypothetical protein
MRRGVLHYARIAALVLLPAAAALLFCRPAAAQLLVTSADGNLTYHLGFLAQTQFQDEQNPKPSQGTAEQIGYLRRLRLQGEFTLYKNFIVFFETDDPNYGKDTNSSGTKNMGDVFFQTVYLTYQFAPEFMIDSGMLLTPNNYNHLQSAASIMPIDLSPYANIESTALNANNGRDWGVEIRGYIADHLEYRGGIFQGDRGVDDINSFRYIGRLSLYLVGIETTRFYRGTSLGKYQTFEIGGSYDSQKTYKNYDVDMFYDQPIGQGDGFTAQFDYNWINGGIYFPSLPKQNTLLAEIGYYINSIKTQPFAQYTSDKFNTVNGVTPEPNTSNWQIGLGWYFHGYQSNFKIGYGQAEQNGVRDRNNIIAQYQFSGF